LDGVLLAAFNASYPFPDSDLFSYNAALGVDPADQYTLAHYWRNQLLRQYSLDGETFGELLQIGTPGGLPMKFYDSGEFQYVPEPATFVLLFPVIAVIGFRIRNHARLSS
jgi:hypothetical protein